MIVRLYYELKKFNHSEIAIQSQKKDCNKKSHPRKSFKTEVDKENMTKDC